MKFKNFESLGKNRDFQRVYHNKRSFANKDLVMYISENSDFVDNNKNRLGISVSKKVGNSVIRHHLCRLIREAYRSNADQVINGYDIVVVVRSELNGKSYADTEKALMHLLKKHKLLSNYATSEG
ncbi:MAG: ribonuclease P protein component [Clostridiales bacterium]|nr:ribonuclease P protein component [Clostridiales bacterium]MBS5878336.1 ribonuclease P protein component [Clostridiales bacterium]MDU0939680.1 ribonuclease P protein component [Clostridiales bacterium]MDU1042634.1 ribonuclease P protein component [Clostridiales bacterium]MDU3489991.1 ribonuclease P protein component [Clostridiales bacterium]